MTLPARVWWLFPGLVVLVFATSSCPGPDPADCDSGTGPNCPAPRERACANGADDDGDQLTDCADSDCLGETCSSTDSCISTPVCLFNGTCGGQVCTTPPGACYVNPGTCTSSACSYTVDTGKTCEDGDPCTSGEQCLADAGCGGGSLCSLPPVCRTAQGATCVPGVGCSYPATPGAGCDDNNPCTFNDGCDLDAGCSGTAYSCPTSECLASACLGDGGCGPSTPRTGLPCDGGVCSAAGACSVFPYAPANFNPAAIAANGVGGPATFNCNDAWFNSSDGGAHWCSGQPAPGVTVINQDGGASAVVLAWSGLTVGGSGQLTLVGSRPVILAVYGDATIGGLVNARSAIGADAGAGSSPAGLCDAQDGAVDTGSTGGGGGGGGYGFIGGDGGSASPAATGGTRGSVSGNANIRPLRGGCPGGSGGRASDTGALGSRGGAGGGAVQISAAGNLTVSGTVTASGGGGLGGRASNGTPGNGGGAGGSGGAVLLEGLNVDVQASAELTANGGGGGAGSNTGTVNGGNGGDGLTSSANRAAGGTTGQVCAGVGGQGGASQGPATAGGNAVIGLNCGGGGGGGAAGRIHVHGQTTCTISGAAVVSPASSSGGTCP